MAVLTAAGAAIGGRTAEPGRGLLADHLLVTWYGNPRSAAMGILGEQTGRERADALRAQAAAYRPLTSRTVVPAYHLVATVALCTPGADQKYRRRETADVIGALLAEARREGFRLILDIQPGRSTIAAEVAALSPFLGEPDVDLALDPEYDVTDCQVPGQVIGGMPASEVNDAIDALDRLVAARQLPPKVLIVHQFRLDMLPDKLRIRRSPNVDLALVMDGFGSRSLKLASYRAVMRQGQLDYPGIKLFYRQDSNLFEPADVLALRPLPAVVIYQ
jgi:hypothetical protein